MEISKKKAKKIDELSLRMVDYMESRPDANETTTCDMLVKACGAKATEDEIFDKIDKMIATGKTGWHKNGSDYKFNCTWGNGYPAPNGECEDEDIIFGITITRGKKQGTIRHGTW